MRRFPSGVRGIVVPGAAIAALLLLAGCSEETNPATNVTSTSATFNGTLTWQNGEGPGEFWWEYSKDNGATWTQTSRSPFGRLGCSDPSGTCSVPVSKNVTGLSPDSHYIFRLAGWTTINGNQTPTMYGDSNWRGNGDADPPYEYDSFDTPPTQLPDWISTDMTLTAQNSPYVTNGTTITNGATVTIEPGVVIKGNYNSWFSSDSSGTLNAQGTAANPIVFRSNQYNEPGMWYGVGVNSDASVLRHVVVRHARDGITVSDGGSPTITDSLVHDNSQSGIRVLVGGSPEIRSNTVLDNGEDGISYGATQFSSQTGQVRINDNVVERNGGDGIDVSVFNTQVVGDTVSGNTLNDNGGTALSYHGGGAGKLPSDLDDHPKPTGNGSDAIWMTGHFEENVTWEDRDYPIVPMGQGIDVYPGVTLTIAPGVIVKGAQLSSTFWVQGNVIALGTGGNPIVFTSLRNDAQGGDTNGDGAATQPAPRDWGMFWFGVNGGTGSFEHVELSYGGGDEDGSWRYMVRVECPCPTPPTFRHSLITRSPGALVTGDPVGGAQPIFAWNKFRHNSTALTRTGDAALPAPNNDWNSASGPFPMGTGDPIVGPVDPTPIHQDQSDECGGRQSMKDGATGKKCNEEDGDPVAVATGEFAYSATDLRLSGKSFPLEFTRNYNAMDEADSGLGPGWSHAGLIAVFEQESGDVLIRRPDGRQDLFTKAGETYTPPTGVHDDMVKEGDGTFQVTTPDQTVYDFDETGRIASITDDHGQETVYGYNSSGRLQTITDPSGQQLSFGYDSTNHITSVSDSTGRTVTYSYTVAGDLVAVTDPLNGVWDYDYDNEHRMTSITDPRGNAVLRNTYDGQGRVIEQRDGLNNLWTLDYGQDQTQVTDSEGGTSTYQFDSQKRLVAETDPLGHTTSYSYDEAGNISQIVRPGGAEWTFDYDEAGNLISATDPEGGQRSYDYDSANHLTSYTDPRYKTWAYNWTGNDLTQITGPADAVTEIAYDSAGLPLSVTDPNDHTTELAYDGRGNLGSVTNPLDETATYAYNGRNYLTSKTEPGKPPETYERSPLGDVLAITTPKGHRTEFDYDPNGLLTKRTDPAGNEWQIQRNAMELATAYIDPAGNQTNVAYDGNLNPVQVTDRRGEVTNLSYDPTGQLIEVARPEGEVWHYGYDARGNLNEIEDPKGAFTDYSYDENDRLTQTDQPLTITTSYGYDLSGNLTSVTDPRGNTSNFAYDERGHLIEISQPLGQTTSFAYDPGGNLVSRTTGVGTLTYSYDQADRLTQIASGADALRTFGYDASGSLTSATDASDKTITIGYDADHNVTSLDDGHGQTVSRSFNSRELLVSQTDGRGTTAYGYDALGRLSSLADPQSQNLEFSYDPEGNLTRIQLPNGVVTTNSYDGNGRLLQTNSDNGPTTIDSRGYAYDNAGNLTSFTDRQGQTTAYSYDPLNRLTQFDPPSAPPTDYTYDPAGNRTQAGSTTYSYDALNRLTGDSAGTTYTYDGAGRLIEKRQGSAITSYAWSPLDELVEVDDGTQPVSFTYDGLGRRSQRSRGGNTETAHYGDLSDMPILDTDSGGIVRSYVQGPTQPAGMTDPSNQPLVAPDSPGPLTPNYLPGPIGLVEQRSGSETTYPLADVRGDITTFTDAAGSVTSRQTYDSWGTQDSGPTQQMGFLGFYQRRTDPDLGLVQMGVRAYDPILAQFLSQDPLLGQPGGEQSWDRYPYAWDRPLGLHDLDGRVVPPIRLPDISPPDPCDLPVAGGLCKGAEETAESSWEGARNLAQDIRGFIKDVNDWIDCAAEAIQHPEDDFWCIPDLGEPPFKPDPEEPPEPPLPPPPPIPSPKPIPR